MLAMRERGSRIPHRSSQTGRKPRSCFCCAGPGSRHEGLFYSVWFVAMSNLFSSFRSLLAAVLFCTGICAQAQLIATTWNPAGNLTQPSDGLWTTAGNWSADAVPAAGYKAYFNLGANPCLANSTVGGCQLSIGDGGAGGILIVTNGGHLSAGDTAAGNNDQYAWTAVGYDHAGE